MGRVRQSPHGSTSRSCGLQIVLRFTRSELNCMVQPGLWMPSTVTSASGPSPHSDGKVLLNGAPILLANRSGSGLLAGVKSHAPSDEAIQVDIRMY